MWHQNNVMFKIDIFNTYETKKTKKKIGARRNLQWLVGPFLRTKQMIRSDCEIKLASDFFSLLKWRIQDS